MSGFVIDASVLATWFLEDETDARVEFVVESLARLGACSPSLFFFEIRNTLLVNERRRRVTAAQSAEFVRELSRLPLATLDCALEKAAIAEGVALLSG